MMRINTLKAMLFAMLFTGSMFIMDNYGMPADPDEETKDTTQEIVYDTIFRLGGKKIICNVLKVRYSTIYYYLPENNEEKQEIGRKQVQKIVHASGKVEVFNDPIVMMVDENDWQSVWVTEKKKDVESMYERGELYAESSASSRSIKAAKRSATIKIQKRAANKGANVVLITKAEAKGGFGDFPSYTIEGVAYSFTPPKAGEGGNPDE